MKQSDINQIVDALKPIFATKDDLKDFATKDDFKSLEAKMDTLDAKQDFINIKLDGFLGEILNSNAERELQANTISEHSDELEKHDHRIKALEKRQKSSPSPISL